MRGGRESGVALVLVLWVLALLTVMAMGYSDTMRTETRLTAHAVQSAEARARAQAGIWLAVRDLLRPPPERTWRQDGTAYSVPFGESEIVVRLYDEAGKIDLNTARPELLEGALVSAGLDETQARARLQAILDWRDPDDRPLEFGAEDAEYRDAGYEYGAKDGPFNSVGELRRVLGMTEPVFQRIAPSLTVHSHQPLVNPEVAVGTVLSTLPGTDPADVDAYLQSRRQGDAIGSSLSGLGSRFLSRSRGRTFTVSSTGTAADSRFTIEAVVLLKTNARTPYSVLSWVEGITTPTREGTSERP